MKTEEKFCRGDCTRWHPSPSCLLQSQWISCLLSLCTTHVGVNVSVFPFSGYVVSMCAAKRRYAAVAPDVQRTIATEYQQGGHDATMRGLAARHHLPVGTVGHLIQRAAGGADPVTPRGHKERKLDEKQEAKLQRALDANPFLKNRDLAAAVGGAIAERTVSDYLARADPPFTTKVVQDQEPEEKTDDWKEQCRAWVRHVTDIPLDTRVYEEKCAIYANEAPRVGRSRVGVPIMRARSRYAKRYTLHMYVKRTGVLYWELCDKNAVTAEIERVAAAAAEHVEAGDVLIWDRLDRSGRCRNPTAQHYSPVARSAFTDRGAKVEHLPPKGKYFNPLELLFNDLKSHYIRPAFPGNGKNMGRDTLESLIRTYMDERAAAALPGFFKHRANGASAFLKKII